MTLRIVGPEAEAALDWLDLTRALEAGHRLARAQIGDTFLYRDPDTLLSRSAWIDGLGALVKTATVFPRNPTRGLAAVGGAVSVFDDQDGRLKAMLDFALVTKWKTAGDSLLGALRLARPESKRVLILGAGTVAASVRAAYGAGFPEAEFHNWARDPAKARAFGAAQGCMPARDLPSAVEAADIVICATMSTTPILHGDWLRAGQHIDLIGAYRPDMREADDAAMTRAAIFVDSRATTIGHIGEIEIPLANGTITPADIRADFYDGAAMARPAPDTITLFKNGGGAHLDLMTATYILSAI